MGIVVGVMFLIIAIIACVMNTFSFIMGDDSDTSESFMGFTDSMRDSFAQIDTAINDVNGHIVGGPLESNQIKAIYYTVCFDDDLSGRDADFYADFVDCFVYHKVVTNDQGETSESIHAADFNSAYMNLERYLGRSIDGQLRAQAGLLFTSMQPGGVTNPPAGDDVTGPPPDAFTNATFARLIAEAEKYLGMPYVWGGSTPETSFDCSGFICWVYTNSGVHNLPRTTAQGIYNQCTPVSRDDARPGDLIFFTGTYSAGEPVTHIGLYVGGNKMIHCGNPIQYASTTTDYWSSHFYSFGRLS